MIRTGTLGAAVGAILMLAGYLVGSHCTSAELATGTEDWPSFELIYEVQSEANALVDV